MLSATSMPSASARPLRAFASTLRAAMRARARRVGTERAAPAPARGPAGDSDAELLPLLAGSLVRTGPDATRLLYVGDLSPRSGVLDFLSVAIRRAERDPDTVIELCWAGRGDLSGVLRAQLAPPNLLQRFHRPDGAADLAALVARCGVLVVPTAGAVEPLPIRQAMAGGLPVLGSARCPQVRHLVTPDRTGWQFDPFGTAETAQALDTALATPRERLDAMRGAAREQVAGSRHRSASPALVDA